jgi:hypothetical protein
MRENQCARSKLGATRYEEQIGNITKEEAAEIKAAQIAKIYRTARLVR